MVRYYCDFCDMFLTHDSAHGRRQHNYGWRHRENVLRYYKEWIDQEVAAGRAGLVPRPGMPKGFAAAMAARAAPPMPAMPPMPPMMGGGLPPGMSFPPRGLPMPPPPPGARGFLPPPPMPLRGQGMPPPPGRGPPMSQPPPGAMGSAPPRPPFASGAPPGAPPAAVDGGGSSAENGKSNDV